MTSIASSFDSTASSSSSLPAAPPTAPSSIPDDLGQLQHALDRVYSLLLATRQPTLYRDPNPSIQIPIHSSRELKFDRLSLPILPTPSINADFNGDELHNVEHKQQDPQCSIQRNSGKIQIILGPMFSGKTTELLRRVKRSKIARQRCLLVKYAKDVRYHKRSTSTHDQQSMEADISCTQLSEIKDEDLNQVDIIAIDEGQFFKDLNEWCEHVANMGKTVIVSALDGTFERKPFMPVLLTIPLAEDVTKLKAICMRCHKKAAFSKRLGKETQVEVIGGSDKYIAVCRPCYFILINVE